jgi:tetratricopeptide (TPR) repeat protein
LEERSASRSRTQLGRSLALFQKLGRHVDAADTLLVLDINAQRVEGNAAAAYYQRSLEELQRAGQDAPPALLFRVKVYLAGVLSAGLYRLPEASALLDQAVALAAREPSIPHDQLPAAWTHQGEILLEEGHFNQAEVLFHKAIAADKTTFDAWMGLARSSYLKQDFQAASEFARRNYELTSAFNRDNFADTAEAAMEWARYRAETGETEDAVTQIRAAMPEIRKMYTVGGMLARYVQGSARVYNRAGLFAPAEQDAREALDAWRHGQLPGASAGCRMPGRLGLGLAGLKRYREAVPASKKPSKSIAGSVLRMQRPADRVLVVLNQARNL